MKGPIKPKVLAKGQRYVDAPVYEDPKKESEIAEAVREAFGGNPPPRPVPLIVAYRRSPLKWPKPPTTK